MSARRLPPYRAGLRGVAARGLGNPAIDRVVCEDYPSRVLHGTTRVSARAFKAGVKPGRVQRTINEWGTDVILASERDIPQQALMFSKHGGAGFGGRTLLEFKLRCGARVLDVSDEMHRTRSLGIGDAAPVAFRGRPTFTNDMGQWLLDRRRASGAEAARPRGAEWTTAIVDPTSPKFSGSEYLRLLLGYARDRGYAAVRMADELAIADPSLVERARTVPKREREKIEAQPPRCGRVRGLFTESFDCPPTPDNAGQGFGGLAGGVRGTRRYLLLAGGAVLAIGGVVAWINRGRLARLFASPFSFLAPVPSGWGDPREYRNGIHEGVDFLVPVGTPVLAIDDGEVVRVSDEPCQSAGKHVVLEHGRGEYRSTFMHFSRIDVRRGQRVKRGERLGLSGTTGGNQRGPGCTFGSAAPHLHLTVRQRVDRVKPGTPTGGVVDGYAAVPAEPLVRGNFATRVVAKLASLGIRLA